MSVLRDELDFSMMEGQSKRAKECDGCVGMGNSMAVQITRKEDGFLWSCHRCRMAGQERYSGFFPDEGASESQVKKLMETNKKKKTNNRPVVVTMPEDYTTTIPPKELVNLYNMELDPDDIETHEIGYCPSRARIVVPIYKYIGNSNSLAKKLVGVMGRKSFDDTTDKPKWWTQRQADIKHPRFVVPAKAHTDCRKVVFVENIFSAIKVHKATGWFTIALLTTYFPYELQDPLRGYEVWLWLDADAYGKACKYQATLGNCGITAHTVLTQRKPKDYPLDSVQGALDKAASNVHID